MDELPTEATFAPHTGSEVTLSNGTTLTLVSVTAGKPQGQAGERVPFSLLLRGKPHPVIQEGLHRLTLADGAAFELYMIPIHTPSRDHQDYQVVFN